MPLHYTPNQISNAFEGAVVRELAQLDSEPGIDGFIAHNVLLPHVQNRYLPNEHDVILLLSHAGYTIDAKEYEPGDYRFAANGPIEYRRSPNEMFRSLLPLPRPYEVAYKKANVLHGLCRKVNTIFDNYRIESLIVVPDHARLVDLGHGKTPIAIRLRVVKLSELRGVILGDMKAPGVGKALGPSSLEQIFDTIGARSPSVGAAVEVCDLRFQNRISRNEPGCLVQLDAYKGEHTVSRIPTEIRVYRKWPWNADADRFMTRMRRRVRLLQDICLENVPRVIQTADLPDAFILATKWFDGETVTELVRRRASLSVDLASNLIRHLAQTVQCLHAKNITHLDIRPEHVWVAPALEEHGGSRHLLAGFTSPLIDEARLSTQAYANGFDASFSAPEMQYHHHPDRGKPQNDVFSLGRLLAYSILGEDQYRHSLQNDGTILLPDEICGSIRDCIRMSSELRVPVRLANVEEFVRLLEI